MEKYSASAATMSFFREFQEFQDGSFGYCASVVLFRMRKCEKIGKERCVESTPGKDRSDGKTCTRVLKAKIIFVQPRMS